MDSRYLDDLFPGQHFKTPGITLAEAKSKPGRGITRLCYYAVDQLGEVVLSLIINHLLRRRSP